jgi:YHS domain-containing protein
MFTRRNFYNNFCIYIDLRCVEMPTDPVCYMVIDEDEASCRCEYKGQEFFFCLDFCRKKFEENPDKYARLARSLDIGPDISC